jgi:hypothetical protein
MKKSGKRAMKKDKSQITRKVARWTFLGSLLLGLLETAVRVLVLCGWLLRNEGWQAQLQIGRWLWITNSVAYDAVFLVSLAAMPMALKIKIITSTWCHNIVSWVSGVTSLLFMWNHNVVAAIYVFYVGLIFTGAMKIIVNKDSMKRRSETSTMLFRTATIAMFALNNVVLVFVLIAAQLLVGLLQIWTSLHASTKKKPEVAPAT